MNRIILMLGLMFVALGAYSQEVEFSATDLSSSMLKDKADNEYGKCNMQKYTAKGVIPLVKKTDKFGMPALWNLSFNGQLGVLDNKDEAKDLNPDRLVNVSANVSHLRHLSQKWFLIALLGAGV